MWSLNLLAIGLVLSGAASAAKPPVTAIAFTPDGRSVVVGSQSGLELRQWPGLQRIKPLPSSLVGIHSISFSPEGARLAVAGGTPSEQGTVEIYSWPEGKILERVSGHADTIHAVVWRDEDVFATGSLDHEIALWRLGESVPLRRLQGHSKGVTTLEFLADGKWLLSGSLDHNVRLWDTETGELVRTLNNHARAIHGSRTRPVRSALPLVATVSDDRTVRLWQPTIGRMVRFCRLDVIPLAVAWHSDGTKIVVACSDGSVRVIDPDTAATRLVRPSLDGWAYVIEAHPSDQSLVIGGFDGQVQRLTLDE